MLHATKLGLHPCLPVNNVKNLTTILFLKWDYVLVGVIRHFLVYIVVIAQD